jgi:outer membrane protein W
MTISNGHVILALIISTACCAIAPVCRAQDEKAPQKPVAESSRPAPAITQEQNNWIENLEVGTRLTYFSIKDNKRDVNAVSTDMGSFYGSITELKAVQNYMPLKVFVDYKVNPYWGVELTWDQVQADTITRSDGHNDGAINVKGPILSVFARYPNYSVVTPYAGIGLAYLFSDFEEDYYWQYAIYRDSGIHKNGDEWSQTMDLDNAVGWVVYAGASIQIVYQWEADVYIRYMKADIDGTHSTFVGSTVTDTASPSFPLSNIALGIGLRYCF